MFKRRVPVNSPNTVELITEDEDQEKHTYRQCLCRWFISITIILIVLLIVGFIVIFVVLPLIFMNSVEIQQHFIFHNHNVTPEDPEFTSFKKYGIEGVKNLYVTVSVSPSVSLGVWHILPETVGNSALADDTYPTILYFHDTSGHRITPINMYKVLRKFFHVIAFDYRGYGDSSVANIAEDAIVEDSVNLYKWLSIQTKDIYLWGHSLGGALSTHVISKLREHNLKPMGLFLEAPFTTMAAQFEHTTIAAVYSWLPWYDVTIVDPLYTNGFRFETNKHILNVDCPIMIVHAEDDDFTRFALGEELAKIAQENRNDTQGSVTFYSFSAQLGYDHWRIYEAPELPGYIKKHIDICREYNSSGVG